MLFWTTEAESNLAFLSKFARSMTYVLPEYKKSVFLLELYLVAIRQFRKLKSNLENDEILCKYREMKCH